jgi:hypothetical protein
MQQSRVIQRFELIALLAMIAACVGCWQKIEYKSHASPNKSPGAAPAKQIVTDDHSAPNAVISNPGAENVTTVGGAATPSESTSLPQSPAPASKPAEDDRYAISQPPATASDSRGSSSVQPPVSTADTTPPVSAGPPPAAEPATTPPTLPSDHAIASQPVAKANDDDRYANPRASSSASGAPKESSPPITPIPPSSPSAKSQPSATASTPNASKASSTQLDAWILGSRLSLAALANDRQLAAKNVPTWLADAKAAAKSLSTTFPDLPAPGPADPETNASKQVMDYLLINGQRIGHDLTKQYGVVESSLFEVALKSNLLLLIYRPGTPIVDSVSAALQEAAVRAKLPEKLWQPLVQAMNTQAPPKEVQAAIKKLHSDVEQYLASGVMPGKR